MMVLEAIKRGGTALKDMIMPMAIICVFNFISAFVMLSIIGFNPTPEKIAQVTGPMVMVFCVMMLVWVLLEGGIFSYAMAVVKTGSSDFAEFAGNCSKYFVRLLGINVIGGAITILLWLMGAFLAGIFVAYGGGDNLFFNILGGIVLLITLIIVLFVGMCMLLSQYLAVIENIGVRDALGKGISFAKKYFWRNVLLFVLVVICVFMVSFMTNVFAGFLGNAIQGMGAAIISIFMTSLINGAIAVFSAVAIMHYILGVRQEEEQPKVKEE